MAAPRAPRTPAEPLRRVISPGRRRDRRPAQPLDACTAAGVAVWLDVRPEVARAAPAPLARPSGRSSRAATRSAGSASSAAARERFYAAAHRVNGVAEVASVVERGRARSSRRGRAARHDAAARDDDDRRRSSSARGSPRPPSATALRATRGAARDPRLRARRLGGVRRGPRRGARARHGWPVERVLLPAGEAAKRLSVIEDGAREPRAAAGRAARAARRGRRRRARRPGRVPRRDVPARRALDPGPDDARRPGRLVDRRQDRRRPARGQEPRSARSTSRPSIVLDVAALGRLARAPAAGRAGRDRQDGRARRRARCSRRSRRTARRSRAAIATAFDVGRARRGRRARRPGRRSRS